jgi:hypothetical protein
MRHAAEARNQEVYFKFISRKMQQNEEAMVGQDCSTK